MRIETYWNRGTSYNRMVKVSIKSMDSGAGKVLVRDDNANYYWIPAGEVFVSVSCI